ncbi:MAG: histidinol-phosphate aminotransferase family protein [Chloroflexi bacterium]|nr:histidinol-phosphate aminotransferase family protein [Chloroflexota bacterium]
MDTLFSSEEHGGLDLAELEKSGVSPRQLTDFSVNSNPFGPAPTVKKAIQAVNLSIYPDRKSHLLRKALSAKIGVVPEHILIGNGTTELIWLTVQAFLKPDDQVVILGPTFSEYRRAANLLGARVEEARAAPPFFEPPLDRLLELIRRVKPRLVFVCNPNNPTGKYLTENGISALLTACKDRSILVLDQAYESFVNAQFFSKLPADNCLILRSMTKDFALAGLRLGYALGSQTNIKKLERFQPTWSVNAIAQAAGLAALDEIAFYQQTIQKLILEKSRFFRQLEESGAQLVDSEVHFGIMKVNQPARLVRQSFLQRFILVRDCTSFQLPQYIRVSTQQESDNLKLIDAFAKIKKE